jgi:antitoxin PrlF
MRSVKLCGVDNVRKIPYITSAREKVMAKAAYIFEEVSTISSKGQTTVPKLVRQALGVNEDTRDDPAIASFLSFLSKDIEANPSKLRAFPPELAKHIASLTEGIGFDPDAEIEGDVEL